MAVLLFCLIPLFSSGYIALPDEGVYSAQASALANGSWVQPRPAPDLNVGGLRAFDPLTPSATRGDMRLPYSRHPLYSLLLSAAYRVGGNAGMLALPVSGCVGAAIAAGLIARKLNPAYGMPALLLTGLGSPLLFNSYIVVAHNLATALAGLTVLLGLIVVENGNRRVLPVLALSATLVPFMRTEGSVFVGATAVAFMLTGLVRIKSRPREWGSVIAALVIGGFGIIGYVTDMSLSQSLVSAKGFYTDPFEALGGAQAGPASAGWIALMQPWYVASAFVIPMLLLTAGVLVAAFSLRISSSQTLLPLLLMGFIVVASVWLQFTTGSSATGLLATMPVLWFAIIWLRRPDLRTRTVSTLALVITITLAGLLATIYADGGSQQWGGRLIQLILPMAVPLTVLALDNVRRSLSRGQAIYCCSCLLVMTLSLSVYSLRVNHVWRTVTEDIVTGVNESFDQYARGRTLTLIALEPVSGLPRFFWKDDVRLHMLKSDFRNAALVIMKAASSGFDRVILVTNVPAWVVKSAASGSHDLGMTLGQQVGTVGNGSLQIYVLSKTEG